MMIGETERVVKFCQVGVLKFEASGEKQKALVYLNGSNDRVSD